MALDTTGVSTTFAHAWHMVSAYASRLEPRGSNVMSHNMLHQVHHPLSFAQSKDRLPQQLQQSHARALTLTDVTMAQASPNIEHDIVSHVPSLLEH
jgi:hypothetical protein